MKKWLGVTLSLMLIIGTAPAAAIADTNTNSSTDTSMVPVHIITFDNLEQLIEEHNPSVQSLNYTVDAVTNGYLSLNSAINQLNHAIDDLDSTVDNLTDKKDYLKGQIQNPDTSTHSVNPPTAPTVINPVITPDPSSIGSAIGSTVNSGIDELNSTDTNWVNMNFLSLYDYLDANITTLNNSKDSLKQQIYSLETQKASVAQTLNQLKIQAEIVGKQMTWGAENLINGYNTIVSQQQNLENNLALLNKQLTIVKLQQTLGYAMDSDISAVQEKIDSLDLTKDTLTNQKNMLISQLNLLLGQNYDTQLTVPSLPAVSDDKINSVNFEQDFEAASTASYTIQLEQRAVDDKQNSLDVTQETYAGPDYNTTFDQTKAQADLDSENIKLADTQRKFKSDFNQAYQDLLSKLKSLVQEQTVMKNQQKTFDNLKLKHTLGLVSDIQFSAGQATYQGEQIKLQGAQNDLVMAYLKYQWMIKGLSPQSSQS